MIHRDLFKYQVEGANWLAGMKNAVLGDEMGIGKTCQAIAGADIIGAKNILVLCPGIARDGWDREFQRWQMLGRQTCLIRKSSDKPKAQVTIASYTSIQSRPVLEAILSRNWDLLICDEAHMLKNRNALTTQIVYGGQCDGTKGIASRASRVWLLTGTLIPNGPHEVWTHARALFPDAIRGLERYNAWVDRFCYWVADERGEQRVLSALNIPEFVERMAPFIKRRLTQDVMPDLPPLRFGMVPVQPASVPRLPDQAQEADIVLRAAFAKLKPDPSMEEVQAVLNAQHMHISSLLKWTGIAKAPAVAELIKMDLAGGMGKPVVFAKHVEVFEILKKAFPQALCITGSVAQSKRQAIIDEFQSNTLNTAPPLLCNIDIGSTAITLTASCNVIFAETSWVAKDIIQAAKRCARIGQTRPVLARVVSLKGSLDEVVINTFVRKYRSIEKIESQFVG